MEELRDQARQLGAQVEFRGRTSDEELRELYRRARVLIHPQIEDFGIVAVEAQACGLPVAALRAGGALETVIEGESGIFFDEQSAEAIIAAMERAPSDAAACRKSAERFSERVFDERFGAILSAALASR